MQALGWEGPDAGEASNSWGGGGGSGLMADSPYDSGYNPNDWGARPSLSPHKSPTAQCSCTFLMAIMKCSSRILRWSAVSVGLPQKFQSRSCDLEGTLSTTAIMHTLDVGPG